MRHQAAVLCNVLIISENKRGGCSFLAVLRLFLIYIRVRGRTEEGAERCGERGCRAVWGRGRHPCSEEGEDVDGCTCVGVACEVDVLVGGRGPSVRTLHIARRELF